MQKLLATLISFSTDLVNPHTGEVDYSKDFFGKETNLTVVSQWTNAKKTYFVQRNDSQSQILFRFY